MKLEYPEILTTNNIFSITDNSNGTITINSNQEFFVQDVKLNTSRWGDSERTFSVNASTTYHLRFSLNGKQINNFTPKRLSFYIVDVSDTNYNPNGVDETDTQFDTKYDDMLIAKITTDSNNAITIVNLKNKKHLISEGFVNISSSDYSYEDGTAPDDIKNALAVNVNWSRKGIFSSEAFTDSISVNEGGSAQYEFNFGGVFKNRYKIFCFYQRSDNTSDGMTIKYNLEA